MSESSPVPQHDQTPHTEHKYEQLKPVIDRLRGLDRTDIKTRLSAQHDLDPTVGIAIIHLSEEEAPAVQIKDRKYHFHAASFTEGAVVPHYHPNKGEMPGQERVEGPDDEPYLALTDVEMNTAHVEEGKIGDWETRHLLEGEVFVVDPNVVHSARDGEIAFACPKDHLENWNEEQVSDTEGPQGNRVMTAKLEDGIIKATVENGVPPQFAKEIHE
jgi:hypothetical protein